MEKTVGVIGGLGPEATLDFYGKLLQKSNAKTDQEHLHVIINSNPKVPNRHASIAGTGESAAPGLVGSATALETAGADFLVMVCNTAHAYAPDIQAATGIPFISIIDSSIDACLAANPQMKQVGLLAADGCLDANLYQTKFAEKSVHCLLPNEQDQADLMHLIFRVKANDNAPDVKVGMKAIADKLIAQGADVILAACTEVPLVLEESDLSKPFVTCTDALVDATIAFAKSQ